MPFLGFSDIKALHLRELWDFLLDRPDVLGKRWGDNWRILAFVYFLVNTCIGQAGGVDEFTDLFNKNKDNIFRLSNDFLNDGDKSQHHLFLMWFLFKLASQVSDQVYERKSLLHKNCQF